MCENRKGILSKLLIISGLSRSTYYYELQKQELDSKNKDIINNIEDIFHKHKGNYGVRRVYHELLNMGIRINHKKVQRLMNKFHLTAKKHPQKYHSYQGHIGAVADNLINRNFVAEAPNRKWTTDVSQFSFSWGKCYLSPIMDMYNNEIVGFDLSRHANYEQIERMLASAGIDSKDLSNLIIHSDQGWQYQNPRFVRTLKEHGITQSMSRKGNCIDNSIMESFFGIMKNEMFYGHEGEYESFAHFKTVVEEYIWYYNNVRIKQKTGWVSPVKYRIQNQFIV